MSRRCQITGVGPVRGRRIIRSGKAKKKGGIGLHVTKEVKRTFMPNLIRKRIWVPELKRHVRVRLTAKALKTVDRNGAYRTLKDAGLV